MKNNLGLEHIQKKSNKPQKVRHHTLFYMGPQSYNQSIKFKHSRETKVSRQLPGDRRKSDNWKSTAEFFWK